MLVAHREELIEQPRGRIVTTLGVMPGVEKAERRADRKDGVVIASIQTLVSGVLGTRRYQKFDPDDYSLLLIDEAHHAASPSYREFVDYMKQNKNLKVVGVTATPDRGDEMACLVCLTPAPTSTASLTVLKTVGLFRSNKCLFELARLTIQISRRWLATCAARVGRGIGRREEPAWHDPPHARNGGRQADNYLQPRCGRQNSSLKLSTGMPCIMGIGKDSEERAEGNAERLRKWQLAIRGHRVLVRGPISRPSHVSRCHSHEIRARYTQCIGRGTRPLTPPQSDSSATTRRRVIAQSSKPELLVLDFRGNAGRHRLVTTFDVLAGRQPPDMIDRAARSANLLEPLDPIEELAKAQAREQLSIEREQAVTQEKLRKAKIKLKSQYSGRAVDPFKDMGFAPVVVSNPKEKPTKTNHHACQQWDRVRRLDQKAGWQSCLPNHVEAEDGQGIIQTRGRAT